MPAKRWLSVIRPRPIDTPRPGRLNFEDAEDSGGIRLPDHEMASEDQFQSTFAPSSFGTNSAPSFPATATEALRSSSPGSFASFVFHVAYLEKRNRYDGFSVFFDTSSEVFGARLPLGEGASFRVERAAWRKKDPNLPLTDLERKRSKYVALKGVVSGQKNDWRDVLLEIRALLHEPLHYHPNITRLLGLGWGPVTDSESIHPLLVMEYADMGTLSFLQSQKDPLPFAVKQKLCYDVSRGLAILHACGIVHGDLKHENVLVFQTTDSEQLYVAKLADFGGSVMDLAGSQSHSLRMGTYPYNPPESTFNLSVEGVKKTDVYSFGLLVWRTIIDGLSLLSVPEMKGKTMQEVKTLKNSGDISIHARQSTSEYAKNGSISEDDRARIFYVYDMTIQPEASKRALPPAQAALKGERLDQIDSFLEGVEKRNESLREADQKQAPGSHGITIDSLNSFLGKSNGECDPQDNCPGYRPELAHPDPGEFHFDPLRLKTILDWKQQTQVVCDLERAAISQPVDEAVDIPPWMASYFLFQCYVAEFGVTFDEQKVCYWIAKAAEIEDEGGVNYYAQAWLLRLHVALKVSINLSPEAIRSLIRLSIIRGHRTCIEDAELILRVPAPVHESMLWRQDTLSPTAANSTVVETAPEVLKEALEFSRRILRTITGAVGMPYFLPRKLNRPWDLDNFANLDAQIKEELGSTYSDPRIIEGKSKSFDKIFVNHRGHGLLHLASAMGNVAALRHILSKYKADIDLPNQSTEESPLVCSCRAGQLESSLFLLEKGANPSGHEHGNESPLHWLCSFSEHEMPIIAKRLLSAGAPLEQPSGLMRSDVRNIWADWEELYTVCTTPLGRAVIMKNLPAVKVLLALGANPLARPQLGNGGNVRAKSAVDLAAILTLPDILQVLLMHLDMQSDEPPEVMDEVEMLQLAHSKSITPCDPTTLQSRLVRCGRDYKYSLYKTLEILQQRSRRISIMSGESSAIAPESDQLCQEVKLGNYDIVEELLKLGHKASGSPRYRPIVEAVSLNDEKMFRLLVNFGADISISQSKDDQRFSLLQIAAMRPRTSRPGLYIPNYLIEAGLAVDDSENGARRPRSAFVLAVRNGDFELADLLLKHGANVNLTYQLVDGGDWITVLGELLQQHSEKNFRAIEYLLGSRQTIPTLNSVSVPQWKPDFICNKTSITSALQILAKCPPKTWNTKNQVSARITQLVFSAFNRPEEINYQVPGAGTALCIASLLGNLEVVTALLVYKADKSICWDLTKSYNSSDLAALELKVPGPVGSPLFMARFRLWGMEQQDPHNDLIARLKSIIELFADEEAEPNIGITVDIKDLRLQESKTTDLDNAAETSSYDRLPTSSTPLPPASHDTEINQRTDQTHTAGDLKGVSTDDASVPVADVASFKEGGLAP